MAYGIRDATWDDIPLLVTLIRDSFRGIAHRFNLTGQNCPAHPSNCTRKQVKRAVKRGKRYFRLEEGGVACGCVGMGCKEAGLCDLEPLGVLPQFRERAFGKKLVDHVRQEAKKAGAKSVRVGIIAKQIELKRWYEKQGFVAVGTTRFPNLPYAVTFLTVDL